jgi:MFS transporter, DHA1 family, multidrug resistance protein
MATTELQPSSARLSTLRLTVVLGTLTAFGPLSIDMYLPGLPAIASDFAAPASAAQLTLSLFFLGMATGQAIYGPLADRYGRRMPLLAGCVLYVLASLGCALAFSIESLIALRLVQALGGCAGMVIARSVVRDLFQGRDAARMFSFLMLVMGIAPITAPLIGGQLLVFLGWRAIFWLLAFFGMVCVLLVLFQLPETNPPERRAQAGIGKALQNYGLLLKDRRFVGYALTGGFISAGMFAYIAGSPFVLIEQYGVAPDRYGLIFGANALGLIIVSQLNRRLLDTFTTEQIIRTTLLMALAAGAVLVAVAATGAGGLIGLLVPLFLCIVAVGLVGPNTSALAMEPYGQIAGSASAMMGVLQFGIGTLAGTLVGLLHNNTALPMAGVMALCSVGALMAFFVAVRYAR